MDRERVRAPERRGRDWKGARAWARACRDGSHINQGPSKQDRGGCAGRIAMLERNRALGARTVVREHKT